MLFNGVAWRVRVGSPWRDVPERYGPWSTVYRLFRAWETAGIWALMIKMILALLDERGLLTWIVSVDSTTVRAHQSAAGAGSRAVPGEPADHALGRSRGGWTTKLHLTADADGMRAMRPYVQEGIASRTLCLFDLNLSRTRRASHSFVHAACRNGFYG